MMSKLFLASVLYLLVLGSLQPERSLLVAGSSGKLDLLGKIHDDSRRTGAIRQAISTAQGSSSGSRATSSRTPNTGGGAMIPVYTAGSGRNHPRGAHHSGAGRGCGSCGRLRILLTAILISFCIQV